MLNAFLAIAICVGIAVIVYGVISFLGDMQSDAPSEDSGKVGALAVGIGWFLFWGAIAGACAHAGQSLTAIWIAGITAFIEVAIVVFIWWNARKMTHG